MSDKHVAVVLFAVIAGPVCVLPSPAHASISRPPPSFVVPARDGKHVLVMLSPVPLSEDEGNIRTLPNGEEVRLRETFPSSGLYEVGSTIPDWTVDWYGEEGLVHMSEDGRYVVRINRFGGDGYGGGVRLRWGIKFYDAGAEIKGYHVRELVDYPSLMTFTTADYHLLWIDESVYDTEVHNGFYVLNTSTRDAYRFDVTTGEIVEEYRFWRGIGRASIATLLVVVGVVSGWLVYRCRKRRRTNVAKDILSEENRVEPTRKAKKFSYSLRSLMIVVTVTAIFCSICRTAPQVAVLLSGMALAVFFTGLLVRTRRSSGGVMSISAKGRRAVLWLLAVGSWLLLYALSFGPAMGLARYFDWPQDVSMVLAQVVYAPVYWLLVNTPIYGWQAVQLYFEAWDPWFF